MLHFFTNILAFLGALSVAAVCCDEPVGSWLFWIKAFFMNLALHGALLMQGVKKLYIPMLLTILWLWAGEFLPPHVFYVFSLTYGVILLSLGVTYQWWGKHLVEAAYFYEKNISILNLHTGYGASLVPLLRKVPLHNLKILPQEAHNLTDKDLSAKVVQDEQILEDIDAILYIVPDNFNNFVEMVKEGFFEPLRILREAIDRNTPSVNLFIPKKLYHPLFEQILIWLLFNENTHVKVSIKYVETIASMQDLFLLVRSGLPFAIYDGLKLKKPYFNLSNADEVVRELYQAMIKGDNNKIKILMEEAA
jgi:hypothetical protein